jgi:hypothetical protein
MYGALGLDSLEDHKKPTRVDSLQEVAYIAAGYNHSFAIDREGKTYSFGANGPWLGHNNLTKSYSWLSRCTTAIFRFHACAGVRAVHTHRKPRGDNSNSRGMVCGFSVVYMSSASNEKRNVVAVPRRVDSVSGLEMKSIAVGKEHTLLLTIDGLVYAMGKNRAGCLGAF